MWCHWSEFTECVLVAHGTQSVSVTVGECSCESALAFCSSSVCHDPIRDVQGGPCLRLSGVSDLWPINVTTFPFCEDHQLHTLLPILQQTFSLERPFQQSHSKIVSLTTFAMESCQVLCENKKSPEFTLFRHLMVTSGSQQVIEKGFTLYGNPLNFHSTVHLFALLLSSQRLTSDSLLCSRPVLHGTHSRSGSFAGSPWVLWHSVCIDVLNLNQQICIFALQLVGCSWRKCHPVPLTQNIVYLSQTDLTPLFYPCTKNVLGVGLGMSLVFLMQKNSLSLCSVLTSLNSFCVGCFSSQVSSEFFPAIITLPFSRLSVSHLALLCFLPK